MEPITLLALLGGAMLLTGRKKKGKKPAGEPKPEAPACPVGFEWSAEAAACVPAAVGPAQIHVTGLCEMWELLPSPQVWFDDWAAPAVAELAQAIGAQPTGAEQAELVGPDESLNADVVAHVLVSQSPISYATELTQSVGQVCKLPLSAQLGPDPEPDGEVPPAMVELHQYVASVVAPVLTNYNLTGEIAFPQVEG
jgi:hypothetical protein